MSHTHTRADDLLVFWIPSDVDITMQLKIIPNNLAGLKSLVDGWIERVSTELMPRLSCGCPTVMMVDEEGLLRGKPDNPRATLLYPWASGIVGDAYLVGEGVVDAPDPTEIAEPDCVGLSPNFLTWLGPGHPVPS